ncbi:MAG: ferritin family protein [Nitrospirae bacterium]|nr:ferritin family protein [Nitrospirota bacterium]
MDIFEFAMKMEQDGEAYYRELAQNAVSTGFKNVFTMLANAEKIHYNVLKKMSDNEKVELSGSKLLSEVKNIFEQMKEEKNDADVPKTQIDLYKKASEIEKKSMDFYLKQADESSNPYHKDIFIRIADEEKRHFFIMEEIVNFVSQPSVWLENPEWYHLDKD